MVIMVCVYVFICVGVCECTCVYNGQEDNPWGCSSGTFYLLFEKGSLTDLELYQVG